MFSIATAVLLASAAVYTAEAAVAIGLSATSAKYPGKCLDEVTKLPYGLGSSWQMTGQTCGQKTCSKRGDTLYISYETCGYSQASPPCYTVENLSLDYPACCPRVVCEPESSNQINIDDYEYADYTASNSYAASARVQDEYMMSSNLQPNFLSYEVDLDTDLLALESADYGSEAVEVPAPDYMVDWDTLFGASSSSSASSSFYPSANRFSTFYK